MKTNIYIVLTVFVAALFSACDDQLHLTPAQSVDQDVALNSDANVKTVLVGAYDKISSSRLYGGNLLMLSEMAAANKEIRWQGTYVEPREVYNKNILISNAYVTQLWSDAYETINTANNVLDAIPVVAEADQDRVRGEALFLRGAMFFVLTRRYGQPYVAGNTGANLAVPLVHTPTRCVYESSYVPRNTVQEAYDQVLRDPTTAESLLPASNGFFATKSVAAPLLSRVSPQIERFPDARDAG